MTCTELFSPLFVCNGDNLTGPVVHKSYGRGASEFFSVANRVISFLLYFLYIHKMLKSRLYNRESYALVEIYLKGKAS